MSWPIIAALLLAWVLGSGFRGIARAIGELTGQVKLLREEIQRRPWLP